MEKKKRRNLKSWDFGFQIPEHFDFISFRLLTRKSDSVDHVAEWDWLVGVKGQSTLRMFHLWVLPNSICFRIITTSQLSNCEWDSTPCDFTGEEVFLYFLYFLFFFFTSYSNVKDMILKKIFFLLQLKILKFFFNNMLTATSDIIFLENLITCSLLHML